MAPRCVALVALIVATMTLAGCGGGPGDPTSRSSTAAAPKVGPGTLLPDALVGAQCAPGVTPETSGTWNATGTVKNTTDKKRDLEVLIYVGPAGGGPTQAQVVAVDGLAKGKTADWASPSITPTDPTGPCFIRVRVAK